MLYVVSFTFALLSTICVVISSPTVKIGKTTLIGRNIPQLKQDFFGGIPYAEPPVANLRLKPPVLKTSLNDTSFDASNFGLGCLQANASSAQVSEDCLTINVLRPSGMLADDKLPVLFWTYGGGFMSGASFNFNGSAIVAQSVTRGTPVIYVNFNYRLGPLGFPQGQEGEYLSEDPTNLSLILTDDRGALNLAIKDQLAALEWVQENIEAFGGDKHKVTVFGQSAGSIMTSILFLNSPIEKLAWAAIFESGSAASSLNFKASQREANWQKFVGGVASCASTATSGHTFDCLRNANSTEIFQGVLTSLINSSESQPFDPTIDGPGGIYPDLPSRLFAKGKFARLPFIAGTQLDEGTIFTSKAINSEELLRSGLIASFSPPLVQASELQSAVDKLLELYPDIPALGSPFNTGNETFGVPLEYKQAAAITGDIAFQSQRRLWMQTATKADVKAFGYLFTQPQPNGLPVNGVSHGSDVAFVYGTPPDTSSSALQLSRVIVDYWVSFATSLDPNDGRGNNRPLWTQHTPKNKVLMELNGKKPQMIPDNFRDKQIDFINSAPAVFYH